MIRKDVVYRRFGSSGQFLRQEPPRPTNTPSYLICDELAQGYLVLLNGQFQGKTPKRHLLLVRTRREAGPSLYRISEVLQEIEVKAPGLKIGRMYLRGRARKKMSQAV